MVKCVWPWTQGEHRRVGVGPVPPFTPHVNVPGSSGTHRLPIRGATLPHLSAYHTTSLLGWTQPVAQTWICCWTGTEDTALLRELSRNCVPVAQTGRDRYSRLRSGPRYGELGTHRSQVCHFLDSTLDFFYLHSSRFLAALVKWTWWWTMKP